jgi:hypothetical protein
MASRSRLTFPRHCGGKARQKFSFWPFRAVSRNPTAKASGSSIPCAGGKIDDGPTLIFDVAVKYKMTGDVTVTLPLFRSCA